jgi:FkbM family methyltransferase
LTIELIGLGVAAVLSGIAAALVVLRMRRAGLAIHRQIDSVNHDLRASREEIGGLIKEFGSLRAEYVHQASRADENLIRIRDCVLTISEAASDTHVTVHRTESGLSYLATEVHTLGAVAQDAIDLMARRPVGGLPVDHSFLAIKSEAEILALAESIAILRPLVPYPRWRTDADLHNPDLAFQLRRWIWEYFNQRHVEAPIILPWHAQTRLRLYLGADLSRQAYIAGCFEPNEFALLDRLLEPGMTFVDAGANEGLYAVFAAKRVGRSGVVWAFEPSTRELERLQHNLDLNNLTARVFPIALADAPGQADLVIGESEHTGHNTLGAFAYAIALASKERVELRRLDDFIAETPPQRIDVIKVDVEGAEFRLFTGAKTTLQRYRPVLLFELSEESLRQQGSGREAVLGLLISQGYRVFTFDRNTGLPVLAAPGVFSDNMVAFPEERPVPDAVLLPWPRP